MLEIGVFGGSYFGTKINEFPTSWFKNAKISKNFEMVGKSETFKYQISGNQLEISSEWLKEVWKKIEQYG